MNIIKNILVNKGLKILAESGKDIFAKIKQILGLDDNSSEEEVASALENMSEDQFKALLDLQYYTVVEAEVTKRLEIDNGSDSWFTKHIRPLSLSVITVFYMLFSTCCAIFINNIEGEKQINLVELINNNLFMLLTTVYAFYFGGRTFEKLK